MPHLTIIAMEERLLPGRTGRYTNNIIIAQKKSPTDDKLFKSYDDLLTDSLLADSQAKLKDLKDAKSKSEATLAQYRHKRASKAEEEMFDDSDDGSQESDHERILIDETDDGTNVDELNAEFIIERQIVDTLLSPPVIVRSNSQSSSINAEFCHHR